MDSLSADQHLNIQEEAGLSSLGGPGGANLGANLRANLGANLGFAASSDRGTASHSSGSVLCEEGVADLGGPVGGACWHQSGLHVL